jgi:hypothetical protein
MSSSMLAHPFEAAAVFGFAGVNDAEKISAKGSSAWKAL